MTNTSYRIVTIASVAVSLLACGSVGGSPDPVEAAASTRQALTSAEARTSVQATCKGSYANRGACTACVSHAVAALRHDTVITGAQGDAIISSFATNECRAACIPTTCAIEGAGCGTISTLCGGNLTCGGSCPPAGPDRVFCVCSDNAVLNICAALDCSLSAEQDAICVPACGSHGGLSTTGCVPADASCAP
jgi:hypothetical protein